MTPLQIQEQIHKVINPKAKYWIRFDSDLPSLDGKNGFALTFTSDSMIKFLTALVLIGKNGYDPK